MQTGPGTVKKIIGTRVKTSSPCFKKRVLMPLMLFYTFLIENRGTEGTRLNSTKDGAQTGTSGAR